MRGKLIQALEHHLWTQSLSVVCLYSMPYTICTSHSPLVHIIHSYPCFLIQCPYSTCWPKIFLHLNIIFTRDCYHLWKRCLALCSLKECLIVVGILSGYLASYLFIDNVGGWRTMYGLSFIPSIALLLGMVSDSWEWLSKKWSLYQ